MSQWLFTHGEKIWGGLKDPKEKWNGENKEEKNKRSSKSNLSKKSKNCAIFICPYRETAVKTIPAFDLNWEKQLNAFSSNDN